MLYSYKLYTSTYKYYSFTTLSLIYIFYLFHRCRVKNVTVRTFNPEESVPVYKSATIIRTVNEFDDFPRGIGSTHAYYLNGVKHKVEDFS